MKYVIFKTSTYEFPVMFPNSFIHADVAMALEPLIYTDKFTVVSAGEYCPMSGECSGGSETLNLKSRGKQDASLILMHDYTGGAV